MSEKLNKKCKVIRIPNIYFDGYFPQIINVEKYNGKLYPRRDKYIDLLFKKGITEEEIVKTIKDIKFLNKEFIEDCVKKSFEILKVREEQCDVKILDYIKSNYIKKQLFYSPNHPINIVIKELTIRILKKLNINDFKFEDEEILDDNKNYSLIGQDCVIYPSVIYNLNLTIYNKKYYPNRYINKNLELYFDEYIISYINNCLKI